MDLRSHLSLLPSENKVDHEGCQRRTKPQAALQPTLRDPVLSPGES
jgi:hypothetical protein